MKLSIHRIFLMVAISCAAVGLWAATMLWRHEKSDAEFNRRVVQPELDHVRQGGDRTRRALKEGRSLAPFVPPPLSLLNASLEREHARGHY